MGLLVDPITIPRGCHCSQPGPLSRIPLIILTRAVKETVKKGGMGEGFVPHEPELVKIHCLWPEGPAVFTAWQLLGKFYFNRSKWITYCLSLLCQDPYFSLKNRCLNSFAFSVELRQALGKHKFKGRSYYLHSCPCMICTCLALISFAWKVQQIMPVL